MPSIEKLQKVRKMNKTKKLIILLGILFTGLFVTGCSGKYDSASELFTKFNDMNEGAFTISANVTVSNAEESMTSVLNSSGVSDGNIAVCKINATSESDIDASLVTDNVVYVEDVTAIKTYLMYFFMYSCGDTWEYSDKTYTAGTDSNQVAGNMFNSLGELAKEAGATELKDELDSFVTEVKMDETVTAINTTLSLAKKVFTGRVTGTIVMDDNTVAFTLDYTFTESDINYNCDDDYMTLGSSLNSCYRDGYVYVAEKTGIKEVETVELTSHLIDGSSLLIQGFDDQYYKTTWDGTKFNYSESDLDFGEWELDYADDSTVVVNMNMFGDSIENYIKWCEDTYGENMEVTYSTEEVELEAGEMTFFALSIGSGDTYYDSESYLYQVNDEFLVRITVNNPSQALADEDIVNMAFSSFELYESE
jgi:hypothetical protein